MVHWIHLLCQKWNNFYIFLFMICFQSSQSWEHDTVHWYSSILIIKKLYEVEALKAARRYIKTAKKITCLCQDSLQPEMCMLPYPPKISIRSLWFPPLMDTKLLVVQVSNIFIAHSLHTSIDQPREGPPSWYLRAICWWNGDIRVFVKCEN